MLHGDFGAVLELLVLYNLVRVFIRDPDVCAFYLYHCAAPTIGRNNELIPEHDEVRNQSPISVLLAESGFSDLLLTIFYFDNY